MNYGCKKETQEKKIKRFLLEGSIKPRRMIVANSQEVEVEGQTKVEVETVDMVDFQKGRKKKKRREFLINQKSSGVIV